MKRGSILMFALAAFMAVSTLPATAGGWATVRLDEELGDVVMNETYTIALSVWAHDRTEIDLDQVTLVARHSETGDELVVDGEHAGSKGHYTVDITFPTDGEWKLTARIDPYPDYALPTLTVLSSPGEQSDLSDALNVELVAGSCGGTYEQATPLDLVALGPQDEGLWGQTDTSLADLMSGPNALVLRGPDATALACADLNGALGAKRIVVSMSPIDGATESGLAVLDDNGEETSITVFLLSIPAQSSVAQVDIVGTTNGNWTFEPANLEVETGTMVVWRNLTNEVHTIAGSSLNFKDSARIEPGGSFVQVFDEAGAYEYLCGPHHWMTGTVTVSD